MLQATFTLFSAILTAQAQLIGKNKPEVHPAVTWQKCTTAGGCTKVDGKVVLDANWRWAHEGATGSTNCYTGNTWNTKVCSDNKACAAKCAIDGADYSSTYGITASGDSVKVKFLTKDAYGTNVGSRLFLMKDDKNYEMFSMLNKEFTFDVDTSASGCGLNTALYFVSMDQDGGKSKYPGNLAGAEYGVGYCDAQCPRDLKWINGEANAVGWIPSKTDKNSGVGGVGSCCAEMDVWEANNMATAVTPHSCSTINQTKCAGDSCGGTYSKNRYAGTCDPDGCDFNPYRMGNPSFYGKGKTVDTMSKFTVVTQFIGSPLKEIKRFYVQNGKVIPNSVSKVEGVTGNSITPAFCDAQKKAFGEEAKNSFKTLGGFKSMSDALSKGMVLVLSLWDDHYANMHWLDSVAPLGAERKPGGKRGECPVSGGSPAQVEAAGGSASVTFSNIKFGDINSTFAAGGV
ncbi:glycoside hydrolase family 7 protein [Venturia nashicola]|uniref:Glucanase n=1 Tax=Venturia nashicola TaxID=86259 RepID=A0A4Z1P8I4_9PEZI|nr:glycoside hydrolase family 7 protein [Venturia nashicola]